MERCPAGGAPLDHTMEQSSRGARRSALARSRALRCGAVFVLGLLGGALVINLTVTRHLWQPYTGPLDDKLAEIQQLADRIDVLFIGSSHYVRGINPKAYDARMAQLGRPVFSYSLSVDDLSHVEQSRLFRRLGDHPLPNLRWVFLECEFRGTPSFQNLASRRTRHSYDWANTPEAIRFKFFSRRPLATRVGASLAMSAALGLHTLNIGVLADAFMPPESRRPREKTYRPGDQGWEPYESAMSGERYQAARDALVAALGEQGGFPFDAKTELAPPRELTEVEMEIVRDQLTRAGSLGARVAILTLPRNRDTGRSRSLHQAVTARWPRIPVLSYLRTSVEDELYRDPSLWFDDDHLTADGAARFAAMLARDTLHLISRDPVPDDRRR